MALRKDHVYDIVGARHSVHDELGPGVNEHEGRCCGELCKCALLRVAFEFRTRIINQAVKNNPEKFPAGYVVELTQDEVTDLRSKFLTANVSSKSRVLPKVFTERGLYMLATILNGEQAVRTTLSIIETYAEVRAMKRELLALHEEPDVQKRNSMMRHFGEALTGIVMPDLTTAELTRCWRC